MGFKNWFYRKHILFSNFHLFKIPYVYISSIAQLDNWNGIRCKTCEKGFLLHQSQIQRDPILNIEKPIPCPFCGSLDTYKDVYILCDELWKICDSRLSLKAKHQFTAGILARSRKRGQTYVFTTQLMDSIDKRIRKVVDFTAYPIMNAAESVCKIVIFRTGFPKDSNYMKTSYYKTNLIFDLFDTNEEIDMAEEDNGVPPPIVFQESKKDEPVFFKTWEEADQYAVDYWQKKMKDIKGVF